MQFYKYISTVLHPIVIPTIGVMLYFLLIPNNLVSKQKLIKERKLPIALMVFLFYLLGTTISNIAKLRDLSLLFYATSLALFIVYILFFFKIKASVHLLSLGIFVGFFMILSNIHAKSFIIVIIILFLIAGLLASARLALKAHTTKEIYIGFFIGLLTTSIVYFLL